jgi:hypothetical protein
MFIAPDRRRTILCGLVVAAAFALFAFLSWRKWPDILVDFGQELYIPWRLTRGEVLYRELAFVGGPLSLYVHALLFQVFGVSLTTVIGANLSVLSAITVMVSWLFRRFGTRWSATIVAVFFLAVFAFGQSGVIGNYNYVCPYRHEMTHGLALGLAEVICLIRFRESGRLRWLLASGLLLGLVILTKVEMALAACLATGAGLLLIARGDWLPGEASGTSERGASRSPGASLLEPADRWNPESRRKLGNLARASILLATAAVIPIAIASAALARPLGWITSWRGIFSTYALALKPAGSAQSRFYRAVAGWDDPVGNAATMILFAALVAGALFGSYLIERALGRRKWSRIWGVLLGVAACWGGMYFIPKNSALAGSLAFNWDELSCAFPLLLSGVTIMLLRKELVRPSVSSFSLCLVAVYALGLLPKIVLRTWWSHYGFVLTMPTALVLVHIAIYSLPNWIAAKTGSAACFRGVLIGLVAACTLVRLSDWARIYQFKTQPVVAGPDRFFVDPVPVHDERTAPTLRALAFLQRSMHDDETLVVFPNGTMLNYLLRKRNPTPYQIFSPFEFDIFGDDVVESAVIRSAPDWVVIVTMDESLFGRGNFGDPQYGARIARMLDQQYEVADAEATERFIDRQFTATVFRRRAARD